ncbi:MAG: DUF2178 domain-containing protein [Methanomicrobiales archaeon]
MNLHNLGIFLKIISGFITALWLVGLILGNIYLVVLAIIILILIIPVIYYYKDNLKEIFLGDSDVIIDDERTQLINEKSATMALGVSTAVIIYAAIVIVALRGTFPQVTIVGYALFLVAAFSLAIYAIGRLYYNRKY